MILNLLQALPLLLMIACSHQPTDQVARDTAEESYGIIDAHAHFNHPENNPKQPAEDMMTQFQKAGVIGAVVHFEQGEAKYTKVSRPKNFKMAVCAAITPGETVRGVEAGILSGRFQCMKVYLGYVHKWANDPFYHPFYRLARKHKVPVAFHTGDTYSTIVVPLVKYTDPLQIDEIAVQYPDVKFIIAHMGNPWIESAAEVVMKNDNVYTDVSAFLIGDMTKTDPERVEELVVKPIHWFFLYVDNPKKILFGSDWPLLDIAPYIEVVKRAIPQKHWKAVFHDNAVEVFNLR